MFPKGPNIYFRDFNNSIRLVLSIQEPPFYSPLRIYKNNVQLHSYSIPPYSIDKFKSSFDLPYDQFKALLAELDLPDLATSLDNVLNATEQNFPSTNLGS